MFSLVVRKPKPVDVTAECEEKPKKKKFRLRKKRMHVHQVTVDEERGWCVDHIRIVCVFQRTVVHADCSVKEILSYKEVVKVNPDPNYKRLIVVIG